MTTKQPASSARKSLKVRSAVKAGPVGNDWSGAEGPFFNANFSN